jgi:hypothetical protein
MVIVTRSRLIGFTNFDMLFDVISNCIQMYDPKLAFNVVGRSILYQKYISYVLFSLCDPSVA